MIHISRFQVCPSSPLSPPGGSPGGLGGGAGGDWDCGPLREFMARLRGRQPGTWQEDRILEWNRKNLKKAKLNQVNP